ncbi:MAG: hypothetical protein KJ709_04830, partial [Nanoarchaeota archaeon]|nr:hypothetical protein [Nanoarchaeota archaeon]
MESHRVSMARMLVLVFVAVLMAKTVAAPCCANIESVGDTYACVDFGWTLDECCPDETFWYGADPWLPDSQSDCQANYYSGDDTCDELDDSNEVCELGCCCLDNPIETSRAYCDWYSQGARDFFTEANGFVDGVTCQEMCSCEAYNTCTVDIPIDCPNLPCDEPAVACKIKTCKANQGCVIQDLDRVIDDQGLHRCEGNNWCVEGACVPRTGECIDADNDGYGKPASPFCSHPEEDCAPTNININPGKPEICNNNVDENCNGIKKCCNDADMGAATCEAAYERCECGQATLLDIANKRCCIHTAPYVFDTTVCPGVCQIPAECSNYDGNEPGCVGHTCVWCGLLNECLDTCAGCVESSTVNTCVENQVCKACQPCDLACGPNADCVPASTPVCQCENGYFLDDCTNQFQPGPGKICEERACDACNQAGGTCCPNACSEIPGNLCEEGLFCCAECTSFTCCEAYQSCPAGKEYPQNDDNCIGIACTVACQDRACPEIIQAGTPPCKCGPDIFPTNGQGPYCCATGLQAMPCGPPTATGVISGVIKSSLADDPFMGNVVVSFTQDGNNKMTVLGTGWENRLGEWVLPYSKELAVGQYHVSARGAEFSHIWDKTYEGVTEKPNVELTDSEQEFRDIIIKPSACGVSNPMPVTSFIAEHVKGVAGAKLTWTDCGSTGIVGYNIYRKEKLGAENYVDAGSKIISRSRQLVDTNYDFGSEAKWDTTYKYEIEVLYGNGNINSDRVSITPDFFTGNEPCEGITDDSEICMHKCQAGAVYQHYDGTDDSWCGAASDAADKKNRLRLFCDDENLLDHHSSPAVYDCTVRLLSESAYCTGPDSEGTTHCTVASECTEEDNPFGLYYNHDSCIYFDEGVKKSCYFDYSPYIVDTCKQCDDDTGSCFDYDSAAACTEDNCEYGDSYGGCAWTGNDYQEFGKGYCAPKNYKGTDHCADCNSGELFMDCNNQVCNALGLCMYSGTCQACNAQLGCKDYTSQASCGDFKINSMLSCQASSPLVPGTIVYGNDGCGIGVCRWVANGCIHDADYDGTDDCYEGDWFCQSDGTPPETSLITTGLKVNKQGGTAEFRIKDNKARKGRLYYCLEKKDTTCCVNNSVEYEDYDDPEATRTLTFLQDPGLGSEDLASPGLYRFRFFSQDDFKNFEQAKTSSYFMVDTQEPQISIQVSLLPDTSTEFNSFITADVQVPNDPSTCTVTLGGGDLSEGTFTDTGPHTFIGQYFTHTYEESHSDGQYTLTVSCTDLVGNQNTVNHRFEIDNDINIDNMEPEPKAYHSATQTLKLTTLFQDDTCTIIQAKHGLPAQDYTLTQTAFTNTYWGTDNKKHHSLQLTLDTDKYYNFRVKCTHGETSDYGNFIFSIDRKAPESYMRIFNSNGYEYFDHDEHQVRYITNAVQAINLYSEDQDFDGANMKLGLADIKYCFASSFSLCGGLGPQVRSASDGASIAGFTGGWICFKGLDRDDGSGHNEEAETCIEISIDADAPTIWLESPPNGFVTDQNEVTVRGRYQEQNVQEIKIIVRDAQNNYHIHDVTDYAGYRF